MEENIFEIIDTPAEKRGIPSFVPIAIALFLLIGSVIYIISRTMSNRAHAKKWEDYDECGI